MIAGFLKRLIETVRAFILAQVLEVKGLLRLLMKDRKAGRKWTPEERRQVLAHLKALCKMVPVIVVFLLPGGSLILPLLAGVLGRRKPIRPEVENPRIDPAAVRRGGLPP